MGLVTLFKEFLRGQENAQDQLNDNFTKIEGYIDDTGWLPITLTSDFRPFLGNTSNSPKYRRIGKNVEIKGVIQPTSAISASSSAIISVLPEEIRPNAQNVCVICQGSAKNTWLAEIESSGNLKFSRYGTSVDAEAATNIWLPFTIRYFIG